MGVSELSSQANFRYFVKEKLAKEIKKQQNTSLKAPPIDMLL
jgi:hypothetical protein